MYRGATVGVVVPAYNEEGFVGRVIDTLPEFVDRAYVVDDGSTDDTWAEIQRHAEAKNEGHDGPFDDLVVPIQHPENRGVGGAIKTGYLRARDEQLDVTAVLGGDAQMDPEELTRYLDPIVEGVADYAKGNRFYAPEAYAAMPRFRLAGNVVLSYLTKIASGYWTTMDSQNGYAAISLAALERTDIEGMYEYYGYCNDLLVRLNVANVRVADVPRHSEFAYADGWKSHISYTEYIPRVSVMLFRGFLWRLKHKYLLNDYNPLATLYLFGLGLFGASGLGLLASLRKRGGHGGWLAGLLVSLVTLLYATMLDREDNEHLELQVPPAEFASDTPDADPSGNGASQATTEPRRHSDTTATLED
ncbi:glycosyltransferase family 2 protein [Halorarius litoreus]|uniref:glycosyltransferase family 2 protein n=1 Tax=Halorarius litoreus TaxID=2962676 RepID=UPI0020CFD826|nr:glycosyltransferase family 2 protein [Halorarius litoreus]